MAVCSRQPGRCQPAPPPPLPPPQQQHVQHLSQQQADRRHVLALLATAGGAVALPAAAAGAPPVAPLPPLSVPALTETFLSPEGFAFNFPADWVVAFDRSGSSNDGAVIVVGDFRALITVSVFRTTNIPEAIVRAGLSEEAGYEICVGPQQQQGSTQRFELISSAMGPPAAGAEPGSPPAYEYEYSIESCVGEVEEGLGGVLRCIGPFGNLLPTQRRRHIGRCVLIGANAYSLNGSSPEDRWEQVGPILRAVVGTFRA